jgi:hypothetical protein
VCVCVCQHTVSGVKVQGASIQVAAWMHVCVSVCVCTCDGGVRVGTLAFKMSLHTCIFLS